ncbi:MAG TPA: hypothetical protein VI072_11145, partial [Polyangiaceae bacterium]
MRWGKWLLVAGALASWPLGCSDDDDHDGGKPDGAVPKDASSEDGTVARDSDADARDSSAADVRVEDAQ